MEKFFNTLTITGQKVINEKLWAISRFPNDPNFIKCTFIPGIGWDLTENEAIQFINLSDGVFENIIYQPKINLIESEKVEGFTGGENITIIQTPFAKLAICVCYDIEFPEIVRKIVLEGVDLILNPSYTVDQYGEKRVQYCAQARTIENHIYVAKSCLVGIDGSEVTSIGFGKSALYAPIDYGFCNNGIIAETGQSTVEELLLVDVDFEKLQQLRQKNSTNPLKDYQILKLDSINIKTLNF